jgi:hypothetical protein
MFLVIVKTQIQIMVLGPRLSAPSLIELKKKKKIQLSWNSCTICQFYR